MQTKRSIPSNIVVRGTNWVGDTVMSIPALRELRRLFPSSHLTAWIPAGLSDLMKATGIPDEVISFNKDSGGPLIRPFRMARKLATRHFDAAVFFQNAFESAFTTTLARIPTRAGYPTDLRGPLLTIKAPLTSEIRRKHQVFYYLGITRYLESYFFTENSKPIEHPDCSIFLGMGALGAGRELLLQEGTDLTRSVIVLCPGSVNSEAKRWPPQSFAALADLLMERLNAQVVFLGAPGEVELVNGITSLMRHRGAVNLAGKARMDVSMAIMHLSRLVVSNDTGSAHLAVAASAEVITIFGPTIADATAPYGPNAHIVQGAAPCAPCRHFRCPIQGHPCMTSITPHAVLKKITDIMSNNLSASRNAR